jgi:hypothetical protein
LLEKYAGHQGAKQVQVELYRRGVMIVKHWVVDHPNKLVCSEVGSWVWTDNRLVCHFWGDSIVFERIPGSEPRSLREVGESTGEKKNRNPLEGIELTLLYERKLPRKS